MPYSRCARASAFPAPVEVWRPGVACASTRPRSASRLGRCALAAAGRAALAVLAPRSSCNPLCRRLSLNLCPPPFSPRRNCAVAEFAASMRGSWSIPKRVRVGADALCAWRPRAGRGTADQVEAGGFRGCAGLLPPGSLRWCVLRRPALDVHAKGCRGCSSGRSRGSAGLCGAPEEEVCDRTPSLARRGLSPARPDAVRSAA